MTNNNSNLILFCIFLSSLNFIIVYLNLNELSNNYALGTHTISLFIQLPFLTFIYITLINFFKLQNNKSFVFALLSIVPSLLILSNYFFSELLFYEEDNLRYDRLAKYFIENKTLLANSAFTIQPGYTYYLTIILFFFEEQTRLTQILNILICFFFIKIFVDFIKKYQIQKIEKNIIYYLVFSSTFFLSKNIIFCISEWFYVCLILIIPLLILKQKFRTIAVLLGAAVLVRTNYYVVLSLFAIYIFSLNKNKLNLLIFFLITLIPFFHNMIFHDEYALFISDKYVKVAFHYSLVENFNSFIQYSFNHLLSYFALSKVHLNNNWFSTSFFISIVSLPFFSFYFIFKFFKMDLVNKAFFILILITTLGVTYVFGWAYYPRFQITNYLTILVLLISIKVLREKLKF